MTKCAVGSEGRFSNSAFFAQFELIYSLLRIRDYSRVEWKTELCCKGQSGAIVLVWHVDLRRSLRTII